MTVASRAGRLAGLAVLGLALAAPLQARDWYVATNGSDGASTDWASACTDIQTALSGAGSGDHIYIAGHVFSVASMLNWTNSGVTVRGGYEGVGTPGAHDPGQWPTVIRTTGVDSGYRVRALQMSGLTAGLLDQVTFTNSSGTAYDGGVKILNATATVARCLFQGIRCHLDSPGGLPGAAMHAMNSSLTVSNCTVSGSLMLSSWGSRGGGVFVQNCPVVLLTGCVISNNISASNNNGTRSFGGGVFTSNSTVTITNCVIAGNLAKGGAGGAGYGGGVYASGGKTVLADCVIQNNMGDQAGHGGGLNLSGSHEVARCSVWGNRVGPSGLGGGVLLGGGSNRVEDCVMAFNLAPWPGTGGGLQAMGGTNTLARCLVVGNPGGGLGVWTNASVAVLHSTVADNAGSGIGLTGGSVMVRDSILWNNTDDLSAADPTAFTNVWYTSIGDGDQAGTNGNIGGNPVFERGYYLAVTSPCVDSGSATAAGLGLDTRTTRVDGEPDAGQVDRGYHFEAGLDPAGLDYYVAPTGSDAQSGASWAQAFRTVSKALREAGDGARIHVGAGAYTAAAGETFPLAIANRIGLEIRGAHAADTVVDVSLAGQRAFFVSNATALRIEGLTISRAKPNGLIGGAGLYAYNSSLALTAVRVVSNSMTEAYAAGGYYGGGGMAFFDCQAALTDLVVSDNLASYTWGTTAGGLYAKGGSLAMARCVFTRNRATQNSGTGSGLGGGLVATMGRVEIRNSLFVTNLVSAVNTAPLAHGLYLGPGDITIENATVVRHGGEGIRCFGGGAPRVRNSILWDNGDDLVAFPTNDLGVLSNVTYSAIQNGDNDGIDGCVRVDPLFVDDTYFHLQSMSGHYEGGYFSGGVWSVSGNQSSLIDAGDPDSPYALEPPPNGRRINMGAYGNTAVASLKYAPKGTLFLFR